MNIFRILADVSHTASKCILIWAIHWNSSAEGVSLLTQALYALVFCARYLDLFWTSPTKSWWNFILKNFYIWSSLYILFLMLRVFARTREREKAWKLGLYALGGSLAATPVFGALFEGKAPFVSFTEFLWVFSIILESVCVLPQLLLLRQTTVPTVIDSGYLIALGSYRLLYIGNWIYRGVTEPEWRKPEGLPILFGVLQTALYVDFAWVYWTRQRVKLRGGGVVDSEDLRKGFLVHRAMGRGGGEGSVDGGEGDGDVEAGGEQRRGQANTNRWGARGVSVSADDTLHDHHRTKSVGRGVSERSGMLQEEEEDDFFDDHDDDAPALASPSNKVLNSNSEWRGDDDDDDQGRSK